MRKRAQLAARLPRNVKRLSIGATMPSKQVWGNSNEFASLRTAKWQQLQFRADALSHQLGPHSGKITQHR